MSDDQEYAIDVARLRSQIEDTLDYCSNTEGRLDAKYDAWVQVLRVDLDALTARVSALEEWLRRMPVLPGCAEGMRRMPSRKPVEQPDD